MLTTMTCPYDVTSSPSATSETGSILLVSIIVQPSRVRPTKTMKVRSRSTTPNPAGAAVATTAAGLVSGTFSASSRVEHSSTPAFVANSSIGSILASSPASSAAAAEPRLNAQ